MRTALAQPHCNKKNFFFSHSGSSTVRQKLIQACKNNTTPLYTKSGHVSVLFASSMNLQDHRIE
jgi:hypothetical protein